MSPKPFFCALALALLPPAATFAETVAVAQAFTFSETGAIQTYAIGTANGPSSVAGAVSSGGTPFGTSAAFAAQTDSGILSAAVTMGTANAYETSVRIEPAATVACDPMINPAQSLCPMTR